MMHGMTGNAEMMRPFAEKILPDGTVIRFMDYPWDAAEEILIDEPCPWYQKYPSPKPPFWKPFDGTFLHRLIKLNKK